MNFDVCPKQHRYHVPQLLSGRVSDVRAKGPRFNPGPVIVLIYRLSSAAIAASSICCIVSIYYPLQTKGCF